MGEVVEAEQIAQEPGEEVLDTIDIQDLICVLRTNY